jgi:hypothetical protein
MVGKLDELGAKLVNVEAAAPVPPFVTAFELKY